VPLPHSVCGNLRAVALTSARAAFRKIARNPGLLLAILLLGPFVRLGPTQSVPSCVTPPSGMVSWWPAEGDANDIQDGNDGTLENGAGFGTGEVGQAFSFNGSNQDVAIGNPANLKLTTGLTVDAWINPSSVNGSSGDLVGGIITKWAQTFPNGDSWAIWIQNNGSPNSYSLAADISGGMPQGESGVISGGSIPLNTWTHVAVTYDSASGTLIVYVNGSAVVSSIVFSPGTLIEATNAPVYIGAEPSAVGGRHFLGLIDEVEVFNRALSASEILAIKNAGSAGKCRSCAPAPASMVSWWSGNDNANDVQDGNNGMLENGAGFAAGEVAHGFSLNGSNQ